MAGMLLASLTDAAVAGNDLWSKVKKIPAGRGTATAPRVPSPAIF